jgi:hypothetical protein
LGNIFLLNECSEELSISTALLLYRISDFFATTRSYLRWVVFLRISLEIINLKTSVRVSPRSGTRVFPYIHPSRIGYKKSRGKSKELPLNREVPDQTQLNGKQ